MELSKEGIDDACKLRNYFQSKHIKTIFHSGLKRSHETAKIISDNKIELKCNGELEEINLGKWENMEFSYIKKEFEEEFEQRGKNIDSYIIEDGESFLQCYERVNKAFYRTINISYGNILIVAHSGVNRCIISNLTKKSIKDILTIPQKYGCINIIEEEKNSLKLVDINLLIN